jgi:hypothetical protein
VQQQRPPCIHMLLSETCGIEYFVGNIVVYIKWWTSAPSLPLSVKIFLPSQYVRSLLSESGLNSFCPIFKYLYFNWELYAKLYSDTNGSCLCVGKTEVALFYKWLETFRLSTSAWNTEEQNQYQGSLWVDSLRCFIHILLRWIYIRFSVFITFVKIFHSFCHILFCPVLNW